MSKKVSLRDKYELREGTAFMSGIHALVRLPMVQRWRDEQAGLNTAGFISGYRGSPLGTYDLELSRNTKLLDENHIKFVPGLNEDLGATAVWGSQTIPKDQSEYDGVFGIWYGKGPGVDRSMDALKHANFDGTSPYGGVLAIAADDHGCKSSTLPHQSDHNFMAAFMPELYPASVHEFVEYGLLGLAMSRFAGTWVGYKVISETVETAGSVNLSREGREIIFPEFEIPDGGLHYRWPMVWKEKDTLMQNYKGFAAQAFARANNIDRLIFDSPKPKFGIITTGKSYQDVRQALHELGITEEVAKEIGLRLYKVGMPWPLEPEGVRAFCEGLDEVLVVEEKREMIEHQMRWQLYNWKENVRPTVVGKHDENNNWMLRADGDLDVGTIAQVISDRMSKLYNSSDMKAKLDYFQDRKRSSVGYTPAVARTPYFCSGCPHNSSTVVPEGSRALAGIGCHIMATNMDRNNEDFTHMGGEGVTFVGQMPFSKEKHIFANLGDGTYTHSGVLAIRQAVAASINITYKILFNDAVAMTGGQVAEGQFTPVDIANQMVAEKVKKTVILSERVEEYALVQMPSGVEVKDRNELMNVQNEFKAIEGTTVIIYDQTCAAEKRRRRKRGKLVDPNKRVFINDAVCEGCGDCSVQSNCVSIEPLETDLGRKRKINQSSCNKDFSCVKGFCPSFVTIKGGSPRKSKAGMGDLSQFNLPELPEPSLAKFDGEFGDYNILLTGIGGTGVLTISAVLGMAAHIEGIASSTLDNTGLAQKGGSVLSHLRLAEKSDLLRSPRIVTGRANLLMACDSIVAASSEAMDIQRSDRTAAVINTHLTPTAAFVRSRDIDFKEASVQKQLDASTKEDARYRIPATELAAALMGDSIANNTFVMGYTWQQGLIPISREAIEEAIRLNGVAVDFNLRAFYWGRMAAHDIDSIKKVLQGSTMDKRKPLTDLDDIIEHRKEHLTGYQNQALAEKYAAMVQKVRHKETELGFEELSVTKAVATQYAKILAYKDEYEVARLYSAPEFREKLKATFDGDLKLSLNLAPPLLSKVDPRTGRPAKREFGSWIFPVLSVLSKFKGLRGSAFDIFGYHSERKMERSLIHDYEGTLEALISGMSTDNHDIAFEIANLPEGIRGFGPVKEEYLAKAKARKKELFENWNVKPRADKYVPKAAAE
ncbi:indolepyruvate ferredoxin oxidoreductase family protein [Temperatibacter marinus]|uniref:Indolepyruvate ferredoxin oxidoreductase family protein n=1 Tax=Temperatibacter marinus TaxID=1456591 RepID=A0AA52EGG3_9PROT|nr:indolepyruvate ferredoxin oxidoreductase family protein [Temperatibacter marinus]WND02074.1 indolepyruvate ferredoxin oxidoreductase family protein [Temperatibacter marinus]